MGYGAILISSYFIQEIEETGFEAVKFFWADSIDYFPELETRGEDWMANLHLLLSGSENFAMPSFIISHDMEGKEFLLINALMGCHNIENNEFHASYLYPSEVREVSQKLPEILKEDLSIRWSYLEGKQTIAWDWDLDKAKEYIKEKLIPFYNKASDYESGILVITDIRSCHKIVEKG
ncbi:DUF1877 family protein [Synechococcus sp. PCC 7502]|uniref:DUF1877 family protein n=1 Tax=Synechococcus sp. PCC 7502 TaxID=1173263 RepID=UPI00059C19FD|nr:DUF1877 family protein [Synechococcus sp. PCC 7502]